MAYLSKAWDAYRQNIGKIAALGILAVLIGLGAAATRLGIVGTYFVLLVQIAVYKIIENKHVQREIAVQALWAWVAQIIVAIILGLTAIALAIIALAMMAAGGAAAIAAAVILGIALVIVALRFVFIPYFAHKGDGPIAALEKSWKLGWGRAIRVGIEALVVAVVSLGLAGIIVYPVIKSMIMAMNQAFAAGHYTAMNTVLAQAVRGTNLALTAIAVIILGLAQPLYWLIAYYGAKEKEG
ncbi:MAG: hypothetical protein GXN93_01330 [Candidatus Diapherotrites archaeon]|nr:hypothetical protein [Candidatus Diapherotrites archaeon]